MGRKILFLSAAAWDHVIRFTIRFVYPELYGQVPGMTATVSQLERETREVLRTVQNGEEIIVTDSGRPIARILPFIPTITVSPAEARECGELTDDAIIAGLREMREDAIALPSRE